MAPVSQSAYSSSTYRKRRSSRATRHDSSMSLMSSEGSSRNYIDPWDLENCAYMERHFTDDEYIHGTPALESTQSDFYYLPNYEDGFFRKPESLVDESIGLFAGVEEEDFYNEKYNTYTKSPSPLMGNCYQSYTDVTAIKYSPPSFKRANSYEEETSQSGEDMKVNQRLNYELFSPSVLLRRPHNASDGSLVYVYEAGSRKRKMALPKGNFGFNGRSDLRGSYRSTLPLSEDCYPTDLSDDLVSDSLSQYEDAVNLLRYDEEEEIYSSKPVPKYQLSRYGHLKIDYSFSWNSLDRYIGTD